MSHSEPEIYTWTQPKKKDLKKPKEKPKISSNIKSKIYDVSRYF